MTTRSTNHQAARDLVEAGWIICVLSENSKVPLAGTHSYHSKISTVEQVDKIWSKHPNANIGCNPGLNGYSVIDIDPVAVHLADTFPKTYTEQTPRGGFHLWYKGDLPFTLGELAEGIDTIGQKGMVVLPPSIVNGKTYEVVDDRGHADIPVEIQTRLAGSDSHHLAATGEADLAVNISRARDYLNAAISREYVAVAGRGGNNITRQVATELCDLGLSYSKALELMRKLWNPHCLPPWHDDQLEFFVGNGFKYRQNEPGCRAATGTNAETFAGVAQIENEIVGADKSEPPFLLKIEDLLKFPDPQELVEDLLIAGENVCFFGEPKKGKSTIALEIALGIAAGQPIFSKLKPIKPGPVVYLSGEGHQGMKKRVTAWMQEHGISDSIPFFYKVGVPRVGEAKDAHVVECIKYVEGIKHFLQAAKPVLVVIDTMSRSLMGLDEDVANVTKYMDMTEGLRSALNCTILTLAHSGKDVDRGIRGSNASAGMFDAVWTVEMNDNKIVKLESKWLKDSDDLGPFCFRLKKVTVPSIKSKLNKATVLELVPYDEFTRKDDGSEALYPAETIRNALITMKAFGKENSYKTAILADTLTAIVKDESVEDHNLRISKCHRIIQRLSKTSLAAFAFMDNRETHWCLPSSQ